MCYSKQLHCKKCMKTFYKFRNSNLKSGHPNESISSPNRWLYLHINYSIYNVINLSIFALNIFTITYASILREWEREREREQNTCIHIDRQMNWTFTSLAHRTDEKDLKQFDQYQISNKKNVSVDFWNWVKELFAKC